MAIEGYDFDRDASKKADTWADTGKDLGLQFVGGLARTAGEIGQGVGAREFARGARDVQRATEEQLSPTGKEVEKAAFFPGEGETSVFKHPVRGTLSGAVNLATSMPTYLAGAAAGTAVAGPVGGVVGGALAGGGQGFGAAEYEARRRVEDMSPDDKHKLPVWRDVLAQGGTEEEADEALVKALHPLSTDIMSTVAGGLPGGATTHAVQGVVGRKAAERIALGIAPKVLPQVGAHMAEQAVALGGSGALGETGRQTGEIAAGTQQDYDPLKIVKAGAEGAVPGALFGAHTGLIGARGGAARARAQYDRLHAQAGELNDLHGVFQLNRPGGPVEPVEPLAPPAPPAPPLVGNTPDPAQKVSLKAADTTGGQGTADASFIDKTAADAHAAGEQVKQQADQVQQTQQGPPTGPPTGPPVAPEGAPDVTAPAPAATAAPAPTEGAPPVAVATPAPVAPVPVKPVEAWASFQQRMMEAARQGHTHDFLMNEFKLWKEAHPDQPREGFTRLQRLASEARSVWAVAEKKRMKDAEELGKKQAAEEDARIAAEDAEAKRVEQAGAAVDKIETPPVAPPEVTTGVTEPVKEPPKVEEAKVEEAAPKAGDRGVDKVGKAFTWVETEVGGEKALAKKYDVGVSGEHETVKREGVERTTAADKAKQGAKVKAAVEAKVVAEPLADLQSRAEARREELVKADRDKRAADKAAGKPARFAKIPTVDEIRAEMEGEHAEAVRKAETAKEQAERLKDAAAARGKRKAGTEATEENTRTAATEHVERLSEDHKTHGDEETLAAALVSNSKRDVARGKVVERARAMVKAIEDKIGGAISGKATWSKEGVKQNVLNALRDTKDMLKRWDKQHSEDPGTLKARDARKAKLDQDFVDHAETMFYLREKHVEDLGERRIDKSKERTASEREKGGKRQAEETEAAQHEGGELGDTKDLGEGEHEGDRTGRAAEEGEGELGEHGFTVSDENVPSGRVGIVHSASAGDANGPYLPDHLVGKTITYKSVRRLAGHEALKQVYENIKDTLRSLGPEDPEHAHAYFKHLLELVARMRSVVPHIPLDYLAEKDWDQFSRYAWGRGGENFGGVFSRTGAQVKAKATDGRIMLPERMLDPENTENNDLNIIHEYGHAATIQAYKHNADYKVAADSLYEAYKKVAADKKAYGLTNTVEFLTEGMSDYQMVNELALHEAPADVVAYVQGLPKPTTPMSMAKALVGLIAKAMGVKRPSMSMLDALMRMNEHVMDTAPVSDKRLMAQYEGDEVHPLEPLHEVGGMGSDLYPKISMPTGQGIRRQWIGQVARSKASGSTFAQRWQAKLLNVKTTMQIAQGLDHLFGRLTSSNSPLAKKALDLLPDDLRTALESKPLSRVYAELHQRQNARVDQLLGVSGGEQLTHDAYRMQRKYGMDGTSPDGQGSMWDYFTKLVHDETNSGAFWGGESNGHLDPNKLDHAQALAGITEGAKRFANLPQDLKVLRTTGHEYFERQQKAMSDWLSDNTVDELTDAIRNNESQKLVQAPIFDKAGIDDFKQWLRDKRPDTHPQAKLYGDLLNTGVEGRRLKEIRALAEIAGPYMPLMRRGDYHLTGFHELADAPGQIARLDKAGEAYDPTNADHAARAHEFNTYEFADEKTAKPFIESSGMKAMNTGERLRNKATGKIERVALPKKNQATGKYETNYGGNLVEHATRADGIKARDAFINQHYDRRIHTTLQNKHVEFHQNPVDLELARREMENVPGFKLTEHGQRPFEQHQGVDDMSRQVRKMRDDMEKSAGFAKMDAPDQKVMHDVLSQHALRVLGGTRVQSHRLPRKNVLGASHDLAHNFADYAHSTSGYIARLEFGPHIHRVADTMRAEVKTKGADKDAFLRSAVMHQLDARRDQVAPPNQDGLMGKSINRLLQLSFLRRLASPAFHVINSTEPWMIGLPYMAGEHGFMKSAGFLGKAYNDIGGRDVAWHGLKETVRALRENQTMDFGQRIRDRLTGDDQRAVDALRDRGMIGRDAGMEFSKLGTTSTNIAGRALDRADHVSRQMGQAIEAVNRSAVGLAAYRLAREKGMDHEAAVEHAAETIDNTMGTYDRWNAPPIFNHPLGRLALQFHKYGQRQYYLMGKLIGGSLKGDNKLQNAKAFGILMGTHFVMAGALGLPTEPVTMALNVANTMGLTDETSETLTNSFREAVAAHFGKEIGQLVTTGAVNTYFGADVSSRVGLGQLLGPFGAPKSHKADDIFNYYMKWLAGSGPGMAMDYLSGLNDLASGDFGAAATKLMPIKVLSDTAKGTVNAMHGKVGPSGRQTGEQFTPWEGVVQAFGFRPTRIAEAAAAKDVIYKGTQDFSKTRTSLEGKYISADDPGDKASAWAAIQRFNAQQTTPGAKIQMGDMIKQRRAAARSEQQAQRQGLPTGARVNKRVPEIGERAKATYAY